MPYADREKRNECVRLWKFRNKEKIKKWSQEYHRRVYIAHPRRILTEEEKKKRKYEKDKRYRERHKTVVQEKKRKYYQDNKDRICKKYLLDLKNNINKRIAHNLRGRIRSAVLNNDKVGSAVRDLGCSINEFKIYIESKFQVNMS